MVPVCVLCSINQMWKYYGIVIICYTPTLPLKKLTKMADIVCTTPTLKCSNPKFDHIVSIICPKTYLDGFYHTSIKNFEKIY